MKKIGIIDLEISNLESVKSACRKMEINFNVIKNSNDFHDCHGLIIPGVGNFSEAIKNLHKNNLYESLLSQVREKFTLGICLGMQLLMSQSDESPNTNGLNLIKGKCLKFEDRLIVPHVGWNSIEFSKESKLYDGIKNNTSFYFVHSYHVELIEKSVCLTETNYENFKFVSSLNFENIFGVQFHPEKSASYGLEIYRNFYKML